MRTPATRVFSLLDVAVLSLRAHSIPRPSPTRTPHTTLNHLHCVPLRDPNPGTPVRNTSLAGTSGRPLPSPYSPSHPATSSPLPPTHLLIHCVRGVVEEPHAAHALALPQPLQVRKEGHGVGGKQQRGQLAQGAQVAGGWGRRVRGARGTRGRGGGVGVQGVRGEEGGGVGVRSMVWLDRAPRTRWRACTDDVLWSQSSL